MNKKLWIALGAFILVAAILVGVFYLTRPEVQEGTKTITVTVVHKDETEKTFTYHTDAEYLDEVLLAEGLLTGSEGQYGLVVETVNGERADWTLDNAYWNILIGEEAATTGISEIPVYDGSTYRFVYTPM